jgi:hypothetical protein
MYTLNTDYQLGLITEEQMDSALFAFWFNPLHQHLLNTNDCYLPDQHRWPRV